MKLSVDCITINLVPRKKGAIKRQFRRYCLYIAEVRYIPCIFNGETETDDNIMEGICRPGYFIQATSYRFYNTDNLNAGLHLNWEVNIMNKTDLINQVSESTELSKKDVTKAVDAVFEAISGALQSGDKVQLVGFGNFEVRERSARKGRNPQTGEEIEIPASKIPAFKPGKALKDGIK
ncbi:UNVERIFIED_CONTAM: DNA-binding protein HU-beta [Paenibacillus sp. PvR008]